MSVASDHTEADGSELQDGIDAMSVLNSLSDAVIAVGEGNRIGYVNYAAEHLFDLSLIHI